LCHFFVTRSGYKGFITKAMQVALPANVNHLEKLRNPAAAAVIVESRFLNLQQKGILYLAHDFLAPQDL
jgi:hypothetical protein